MSALQELIDRQKREKNKKEFMSSERQKDLAESAAERRLKGLKGSQVQESALKKEVTKRQLASKQPSPSASKMSGAGDAAKIQLGSALAEDGGVGGSIASGALAGSTMGPVGTAVGAGVGALTGIMKARAAKKARERQAKLNEAKIIQETGNQQQSALANIMQGFRQALLG